MQKMEAGDTKSGFGCHSTRKGGEGLPPVLTVGQGYRWMDIHPIRIHPLQIQSI